VCWMHVVGCMSLDACLAIVLGLLVSEPPPML